MHGSSRLYGGILLAWAAVVASSALAAKKPDKPAGAQRYPQQWDVPVTPGTRLAALKAAHESAALPERDLEDQSRLPRWFRAYLRQQFPTLPTSGVYQYPFEARKALEWMVGHPDLTAGESSEPESRGKSPWVGTNVRMADVGRDCAQWESESAIARNPVNPNLVIAASNLYDWRGAVGQRQYFSNDGGKTWTTSLLPLSGGIFASGDPSVAYALDESAWAATLGMGFVADSTASSGMMMVFGVLLYKSPDRGASWQFCRRVTGWGAHDKEMMWIDPDPASPFRDKVFLVWTHLGGPGVSLAQFPLGCDPEAPPPSSPTLLSGEVALGAHLTSGPSDVGGYRLYVAWPETDTKRLRIRSTTDGVVFSTPFDIATTRDSKDIPIPAMSQRQATIYLSIAVDRSNGPGRTNVYAVWTDSECDPAVAGCSPATDVYFSASTDDGQSWSTPAPVGKNPPNTDQFNPWMDVDPQDGAIHVVYYETTDTPRRKTRLRHVISTDAGQTWTREQAIATAETDETGGLADLGAQYGDYNGLVVSGGVALPSWTDRRPDAGQETRERILTAAVSSVPDLPNTDRWLPCRLPGICVEPFWMDRGELVIRCVREPCIVLDRIEKNCTLKFECPACGGDVQCPASYRLTLEGLRDDWLVDVIGLDNRPVNVRSRQVEGKLELGITLGSDALRGGGLKDYALTFRPRSREVIGREYRLRTSLEVVTPPRR